MTYIDVTKIRGNVRGVIQAGSHHGQEYGQHVWLGCSKFLYFEPQKDCFDVLQATIKDPNAKLFNFGLGKKDQNKIMYKEFANGGMSSSILQPSLHLKHYPHINFPTTEDITVRSLDSVIEEYGINGLDFDYFEIDVQGYELNVLKGASKQLEHIKYINVEVNDDELYHDCARVDQVDEFLKQFGFRRIETYWTNEKWGEAIYSKV
jgi:FkbM family methyltransferase